MNAGWLWPAGNGWRSRGDEDVIRIPMIEDIIKSESLFARFQPIVSLQGDGRAHGYESLIRLLTPSPLTNPVALFRYAARSQKLVELDLACIDRGMRYGSVLAPQGHLFVNVHPQSFEKWDQLESTILSSQERYGLSPGGIVLEITEQVSFHADAATFAGFERLRNLGFRFALDDVGAGFSHLEYVDRIKQSYLKISQQLGSGSPRAISTPRPSTPRNSWRPERFFLVIRCCFPAGLVQQWSNGSSGLRPESGATLVYESPSCPALWFRPVEKRAFYLR